MSWSIYGSIFCLVFIVLALHFDDPFLAFAQCAAYIEFHSDSSLYAQQSTDQRILALFGRDN